MNILSTRKGRVKDVSLVLCPPVWHRLPPLGLTYISEYLKSDGGKVDAADLNIEDISIVDIADKYDVI